MLMLVLLLLTVQRLGGCYIKVDDVKQRHCPLYASFSAPPTIHVNRPFGVSVFTPSAPDGDDEQNQITRFHMHELAQPTTKEPMHLYVCCFCYLGLWVFLYPGCVRY